MGGISGKAASLWHVVSPPHSLAQSPLNVVPGLCCPPGIGVPGAAAPGPNPRGLPEESLTFVGAERWALTESDTDHVTQRTRDAPSGVWVVRGSVLKVSSSLQEV